MVGIGEFITHFRTNFSGDWDVHWGYDLGFDPWPGVLFGGFARKMVVYLVCLVV